MTWQIVTMWIVAPLAWLLLGFLIARARYHPGRDAAARLHAIAREVMDSGKQPRAANGRFTRRTPS
jgi:hypothetical protein